MTNEAYEQIKLFNWVAYARNTYPQLDLLYHVPNGGKRNQKEAFNLKRQGVRAGVPDLCLPVARGKFHALYIELKVGKNKATQKQKEWIKRLTKQGNMALVCYGWEEASAVCFGDYGTDRATAIKNWNKRVNGQTTYFGNVGTLNIDMR